MINYTEKKNKLKEIPIILFLIAAIYSTDFRNVLLFHTIAELFSIIIACSIFILAWNSKEYLKNDYLLFVGIGYLFVGILDLFHTLTYKGMGVFNTGGSNIATQFWIVARYYESITLLIAFYFNKKKLNTYIVMIVFSIVTMALIISIMFLHIFPDCYIEGQGLTVFKKISEYIISFILLIVLIILFVNKNQFSNDIILYLKLSVLFTIFSEICFTFYIDVYGLWNQAGHVLKIISFYFIYKAIIENGLKKPYNILFKNIQETIKKNQKKIEALETEMNSCRIENVQKTKELLKIKDQLVVSKRLSSLGSLASIIAHELKNPLAVINMASYNISRKDPEKKLFRHIKNIDEKVEESTNIINNLLDYSKIKNPVLKKVKIYNLLMDAVKSCKAAFKNKDYKFQTKIGYIKDIIIYADYGQLKEVFINIITNAYQAKKNGIIKIFISYEYYEGKLLTIIIKDNGIGIKEEDLENIFEPFFTTKSNGTGLGLAICNEIINLHNGNIFINSKINKGTTVYINLPNWGLPNEKKDTDN